MGKKAVNLLIHTLLIIVTFITLVLTALAAAGSFTSPYENGFMALMALGLPGLLVLNVLFLVYWILRRRWWFIFPAIALGINYQYYPRVFQFPSRDIPRASADAKTIKVATYNVNYFGYEELPRTVEYIARYMRTENIDAICFQEFAHTDAFPMDSIAAKLGLPYHAVGYNYTQYDDLAIFSRYPISNVHLLVFQESTNSAMWGDLDVHGRKVRLLNAHLQTTSINWEKDDLERQFALGSTEDQARAAIRMSNIMKNNFRRRTYQATQIAHVMDTTTMPLIYCGDTNDTPSSYVYSTITGGDKRVDGFLDAGRGYGYTYHNMRKLLRIDYVMYTNQLRGLVYNSPDFAWSDHNPVIMELELL